MKNNQIPAIQQVDLQKTDLTQFRAAYVGCLILTADNKILLQKRGEDWDRYPDLLTTFGGKIENNESPMQALLRELHEELAVKIDEMYIVTLGAITEKITNYQELVFLYFWHDLHHSITTCNEGEPIYFNSISDIEKQSNVMDDARWCILECCKRQLLQK